MPVVGERKSQSMGNMSKSPMYAYAQSFLETQQNMLRENSVDYGFEPVRAISIPGNREALQKFFIENSVVDAGNLTSEQYEDQVSMMKEAFINDMQAVQENGALGLASYNPMVGLSLPMHKYLMLNCVFAQAVPRFVAKTSVWTETMETRFMVTPEGKRIDIANQQNQIFEAWKSANKPVEVGIALPEANSIDILNEVFHVDKVSNNLSVATHICAVAVEEFVKDGAPTVKITPAVPGVSKAKVEDEKKTGGDGKALVWKPWKAEFTPGYGEYNRVITRPVDMMLQKDATTQEAFHDSIFAAQKDNMFEINSGGKIKAVKLLARFDASARSLKTNKVEWSERTTHVQIPEADGITVPITPEEVKDIGANYGINQVTKYMGMIKDILDNVKDDDIKSQLDESFVRLDSEHKLQRTVDFAPPVGYALDYLEYLQKTFMNTLSNFVGPLLTVLRDPNVEVTIIGRPQIIKQITPVEYSYQTPANVGPIELDYKKTIVSSDKIVYNFIASDKMYGNDNLIVLLNPKNTDRIIYRLYDYQMYISNEIRDAENPALPALTAFQRYKFFEYQPVQGRLFVANPTGLREHLPNVKPVVTQYNNNDLGSTYSHYDKVLGTNVPTKNEL